MSRRGLVTSAIVLAVLLLAGLGIVAYGRATAESPTTRACVAALEAVVPGMARSGAEAHIAAAIAAGGERSAAEPGSLTVAPGTVQVICRRFQPPDGPALASEWLWLVDVRPALLPYAPLAVFPTTMFDLFLDDGRVRRTEAMDCLPPSQDDQTCRPHGRGSR
jgi:hypothetical protein